MNENLRESYEERTWREHWERTWKMLTPAGPREPIFRVGCFSLMIAAIAGFPIGAFVFGAAFGHNERLLGGTLGFFAMMRSAGSSRAGDGWDAGA